MANTTKRGLDLILKAGETPIGGQRGASIEMTSHVMEYTSQMMQDIKLLQLHF